MIWALTGLVLFVLGAFWGVTLASLAGANRLKEDEDEQHK